LQKAHAVIIISARYRTDEFSKNTHDIIFREADEKTRGNPIRAFVSLRVLRQQE